MKSSPKIRILCVDGHPIVREGMCVPSYRHARPIWTSSPRGFRTGNLEKYREHEPDVVVMDLKMPGLGGSDATIALRKEFPAARVIILTTFEGIERYPPGAGGQSPRLPAPGHGPQGTAPRQSAKCMRASGAFPRSGRVRLADHTPRVALSARGVGSLAAIGRGLAE